MSNHQSRRTAVIAVCGKGGVGKTSVSAAIVKILSENPDNKVLAIDADPAVGLATAIGVRVQKTVDDIRNELIRQVKNGTAGGKSEIISRLDYEMFAALEEHRNIAFLAIGRPETDGCYCQVNHILRDIIASIAGNFDYVVIDGEAGIEQVNRRVMESVTHLILVSDVSARALNVARTIKTVSDTVIDYQTVGLILNRVRSEDERRTVNLPQDIPCLGWLPEDDWIRKFDMAGRSIIDLQDCAALQSVRSCIDAMNLTV